MSNHKETKTNGSRHDFVTRLHQQLDQWDRQLADLEQRADNMEADARSNIRQEIEMLKARRRELAQRLERLESAGADAWDTLRAGVDGARQELQDALQQATDRLQRAQTS